MGYLVMQSTDFSMLAAHMHKVGTSRQLKAARNLKRNVTLNPEVASPRIVPPLVTLALFNLKTTRQGLRVTVGKNKVYIPWTSIPKGGIPDCVGRVLDNNGTVPMSTVTMHAKVATELHLI